jgi:hypothetical protein
MKKFVFGIMLVIIGFIFTAFCFIHAVLNPCNYNGITGLKGAFLMADTGTPFIISLITMVTGLCICFYEAYIRKN